MFDVLARIGTDLIGRLTGPLTLRLFLQPVMAALFAARDGFKDARAGRPPYLRTVLSDAPGRRHLLRNGWKAIGKVVVMAIVLDFVYQLLVFRRIYPAEAIDVGIILAILPYVLLRGLFNRLARFRSRT
jgi:hypothetical protein